MCRSDEAEPETYLLGTFGAKIYIYIYIYLKGPYIYIIYNIYITYIILQISASVISITGE